jgi:hypothetical protein
MSSVGAAQRAAVPISNARAEASRKNGAKSRGPKTQEGKARSAMNALKHGLRAEKYVTLVDEEWDDFVKLEAALTQELAPAGPLQSLLARRLARAAWRLIRADRLETEVFAERHFPGGGPGLALIRDGNGTRSIETLLRYRGAAMAEFQRSLRMLKALQAEAAVAAPKAKSVDRPALHHKQPNGPEPRRNPGKCEPATPAHEPGHAPAAPTLVRMNEAVPPAPTPPAHPERGPQADQPKPNEPQPHVQPRPGETLNGRRVPAASLG